MKVIGEDVAIKASLVGSLIVCVVSVMNYLGNYATKAELTDIAADTNRRLARIERRIDAILLHGQAGSGIEDAEEMACEAYTPDSLMVRGRRLVWSDSASGPAVSTRL